jgi:hypothetical protein
VECVVVMIQISYNDSRRCDVALVSIDQNVDLKSKERSHKTTTSGIRGTTTKLARMPTRLMGPIKNNKSGTVQLVAHKVGISNVLIRIGS